MLKNDKIKILTGWTANCMYYTPDSYDKTKKYPLILFFHGMGEAGTDINRLYNAGLPKVLKDGFVPPFECIIVAPQAQSYSINPNWIETMLTDIISRFPIDETRIYFTGLSAGGWATYGSQLNVPTSTGKKIAAIVPLSAATQDADKKPADFDKFLETKTPVLAIVGGADTSYKEQNEYMVKEINKRVPDLATIDIRSGIGHGGWTEIYNGTYKVNGKSVWEWMQQYPQVISQPVPQTPKPPAFQVGDIIKLKIVTIENDQYTFEVIP